MMSRTTLFLGTGFAIGLATLGLLVGWSFHRLPLSTAPVANTNLFDDTSARLHDEQVAEEQARKLWDPVLAAAQTTTVMTFHGYVFQVPQNMQPETTATATTLTFPVDIPEGPYLAFSTSSKTAEQLVTEKRASLSPYETVVQDTTQTINGVSWRIFEQTTDLGINQVTWMTVQTPTVVVSYPRTRDDVAAVLLKIVQSGKVS